MARLDNTPNKMAKANVNRWFTHTQVGQVFLPGNGKAIPISHEEALAIRAGAERHIAQSYNAFQMRTIIHIILLIAIVVAIRYVRNGLDPSLDSILLYTSYGIYTAHGLFLLNDAWSWERSTMDLRDAITHALRAKSPLPPTLAGGRAVKEPNYRLLGNITFGIVGIFYLLKGVKIPEAVSPWLPAIGVGIVVGILAWVAGFVWLQRVGALAPKDGARDD